MGLKVQPELGRDSEIERELNYPVSGDPTLPKHSDEAIEAAALSDPDNKPRTPERERKLRRIPQVKVMRRASGLTQEEFAAHFHIPLGTLRDWVQGKSEPDTCARAYLKVIARNPRLSQKRLRARRYQLVGLSAERHPGRVLR